MKGETTASTVRLPDYELLRLVGRGSYGEVWLARNALGSPRAVKIVWRHNFEDERPYEREFHGIRKFEPVSRKHDGLVDIYHVGRNDLEGYFYYVMELADDAEIGGGANPVSIAAYRPLTLREELRARGRMPVSRALEVGAKLASAVEHLHRAGLVHRDIKPSNIIFVGGTPKLADIGLVAGISDARSYVGTEGFVPPEGPGSPAADLYSLGKVLYEISTGLDRNEFPRLPAINASGDPSGLETREFAEFNEVLIKACDPVQKSRYQTAGELFADLVFLQGGKSLRRVRGLERRTALLSRAGLVMAVIALIASLAYFGSFKQIQRAIHAEQQAVARIERLEMQKVEDLFARDDAAGALASLARILRSNPTNRVAAERLMSALTWRNLPLPARAPFTTEDRLRVAAINPEGHEVAAGASSGTVQFWDWESGSLAGEFRAATNDILALDWSADRSLVAIGTADGAVLHDLVTDRLISLAVPPGVRVELIKLSPDQRWVVTGGSDGNARIWDARTGQPTEALLNQSGRIHRIVFSPDSRTIATAGRTDGAARIWNTATAEPATPILRHGHTVNQLAFSPDGRLLATASDDGSARLWRTADGRALGRMPHRGPVLDVAFGLDGSRVATSSEDGTAMLWDLDTLQPIGRPMAHRSSVRQVSFSPDGLTLATVSGDNTLRLWDALTAAPISEPMRHPEALLTAGFSPSGHLLMTAVSTPDGSGLWPWKTAARHARGLEFPTGRSRRCARLLPHGQGLAVVSDRVLHQWPAEGGAEPDKLDFGVPVDLFSLAPSGERAAVVHGNKAWIWDLKTRVAVKGPLALGSPVAAAEFGAADTSLAVATTEGELTLWRLAPEAGQAEILRCLPSSSRNGTSTPGDAGISAIHFSPDGRHLVAACQDNKARIFETATAALVLQLPHDHAVLNAEFSPDGRRVVTASRDRHARVWEMPTGRLVGAPLRHDNEVLLARFSPDGRRVATAARDWTARVWDAETGRPLSEPMAHAGPVQAIRFSPDGVRVATGSADGTARIWDAETGLTVADPLHLAGAVEDVAFSEDGSRLLVVPTTGQIQLFDVLRPETSAPGWLPDLAEAVAGQRIHADKTVETVLPERLFALKREIDSLPESDPPRPTVRWAKWYMADPERRPISPGSALDRASCVDRLIRSEGLEALKEAVWLDPTNGLAHAGLARALASIEPNPSYRDLAAAYWHQKQARKLSPDDRKVEEICAAVVLKIRSTSRDPAAR